MATYLKRTSKLFDLSLSRTSAEVNLRDLMCPVCRGILIEPVTLPCTHNLCLRCLKGTFEHNSLSCPLCRVRVGSWLRTATKSETLVNNGLWELIRTRFPKEVQGKNNGDEEDLELDSDFTTKKILSAAGEIRKEYEAQLQMAEEEMRREREAERIASEVLIRKIQAEEREQLAQLAQDQLLAKTLAKRNLAGKDKGSAKYYEESLRTSQDGALGANAERTKYISKLPAVPRGENSRLEDEKANSVKLKEGSESRKSNIALISKIRAERYASSAKGSTSGTCRTSPDKFCFQKSMPVHNAVTRTLKHQVMTKMTHPSCSSYAPEPGCSGSKIYGTQCKEELHVPSDVLTSKKKSLGVEICMTTNVGDERIGSAESAGSHDSINQEIHHFKPIKAMPRTPLKMSSDGRQIDPKLIRVIAIIKRIPNAMPKPPSPTPLKRTLGCSWSAFRGKVKQDLKLKERPSNQLKIEDEEDVKPSTSVVQSQSISGKQVKLQVSDTVRRLDLDPEVSFDSNKNYAKNINRIINGTKVSKKLILDETVDSGKVGKSWKAQVRNGTIAKSRRRKNSWSDIKHVEHAVESRVVNEDESMNDTRSPNPANVYAKDEKPGTSRDDPAVENIAERIKKRKLNIGKEASTSSQNSAADVDACQRGTRGRKPLKKRNAEDAITTGEPCSSGSEGRLKRKSTAKTLSRSKRQKTSTRANAENTSKSVASPSDTSSDSDTSVVKKLTRNNYPGNKRVTRNATKITNGSDVAKRKYRESTSTNDSFELSDGIKTNERASENERFGSDQNVDGNALDEDVIAEQKRIERLVQQEKEDFELAQRLQAKFNEMGRIAGRTRGSRRALENEIVEQILPKVDERKEIDKGNTIHTAKRVSNDQTASGQTNQRRKVQRRVLK